MMGFLVGAIFSIVISTMAAAQTPNLFISTNPTVPGQGVSFGSPSSTNVYNAMHLWTTVDGNAVKPTNNLLANMIVNPGYLGPVVNANVELQINGTDPHDAWNLLGVLDIQNPNTGGQATAGIVRGNIVGTQAVNGLRSQAENYTGRAANGLFIGSSQSNGSGAPFDNSWDKGIFIHTAKNYGLLIGGHDGANPPVLPTHPIAYHDINDTQLFEVGINGNSTIRAVADGAEVLRLAQSNNGIDGWTFQPFTTSGELRISRVTGGGSTTTPIMSLFQNGVMFEGVGTTAASPNAVLDAGSGNNLLRSTSSLRYKKDVRPMSIEQAERVLAIEPIIYRSLASADDHNREFVGLAAEAVAARAPEYVNYMRRDDGTVIPDGVQYDRIGVALIRIVQDQRAQIAALSKKIERLEIGK